MPSKTLCSWVCADFETGGLSSKKNPITEIAMIAFTGDTLQEVGRYEAKAQYNYSPSLAYEQRALDVTGMSIETLINDGIPIEDLVDGMIDCFEKGNKATIGKFTKCILVGHNWQDFDNDFLIAIFNHCKKDLSKYVMGRNDQYGNFQPACIDTLHLSRMKWQDDDTMNDFKLGTVIEKAGLELSDAHRAMNDVLANKELFVSFINDLRIDNSGVVGINKKSRIRSHFQFG